MAPPSGKARDPTSIRKGLIKTMEAFLQPVFGDPTNAARVANALHDEGMHCVEMMRNMARAEDPEEWKDVVDAIPQAFRKKIMVRNLQKALVRWVCEPKAAFVAARFASSVPPKAAFVSARFAPSSRTTEVEVVNLAEDPPPNVPTQHAAAAQVVSSRTHVHAPEPHAGRGIISIRMHTRRQALAAGTKRARRNRRRHHLQLPAAAAAAVEAVVARHPHLCAEPAVDSPSSPPAQLARCRARRRTRRRRERI